MRLFFILFLFLSDLSAADIKITDNDHIMGNKDAKVILVEYSSLSCAHCGEFHQHVLPSLIDKYINKGKLLYIHRDFPTNKIALTGSKLLNCVPRDKYNVFLKVLFNKQSSWAYNSDYENRLESIARLGGVSGDKFKECMNDKVFETKITEEIRNISKELDINSTPTFFINNEKILGAAPLKYFEKRIDEILERK